jgi:hypothetical protein
VAIQLGPVQVGSMNTLPVVNYVKSEYIETVCSKTGLHAMNDSVYRILEIKCHDEQPLPARKILY